MESNQYHKDAPEGEPMRETFEDYLKGTGDPYFDYHPSSSEKVWEYQQRKIDKLGGELQEAVEIIEFSGIDYQEVLEAVRIERA